MERKENNGNKWKKEKLCVKEMNTQINKKRAKREGII